MDYSKLEEIGVWLDDALSAIDQKYIAECKNSHINSVCIMINKSNTNASDSPWELRYKKQAFVDAIKKFKDNGIDVTLTCWPRPSKEQLDTMFADIEDLMNLSDAKNFEVDTEGNWDKKFLKGFRTMREAAEYLGNGMNRIAHSRGGKTSLTTFTYHQENSDKAQVGKYMDALYPQAYSVHSRSDKAVGWNEQLGPGGMQELTINRAKKVPEFKGEVACGLAAYDQKWPNHTEAEAMKTALDKAMNLGVKKVRYWSSKWLFGAVETKYGQSFLKSLK